jgi:type IV secretory pathway VirB3-like protein
MKNLLFVIGLIVLVIVVLKILFWTVSKAIIIAVIAAVVYIGFRIVTARKKQ